MTANVRAVPAPDPRCRLTVVIPARNESALIARALAALRDQRDLAGARLARGLFDAIVFANNCSDDTAGVVRRFAARTPDMPVYLLEDRLNDESAHVGAARKHVMDLAAARFFAAGTPDRLIASTDSDTVVDAQWIAWTLREARNADAVAGQVSIAAADRERLIEPVRILYAREVAYRQAVAEIEALIDPAPDDRAPRHSSFVGASFAVSARAYRAAGGLPPLRRLEDLHFSHALRRIDARIRHSTLVRATTSARVSARVDGGFGSFLAGLHACAQRGTFAVDHPRQTIGILERRAALRRLWEASATAARPAFGAFYERTVAAIGATRHVYAPLRVEEAIQLLRAAAERCRQPARFVTTRSGSA